MPPSVFIDENMRIRNDWIREWNAEQRRCGKQTVPKEETK